MILVIGSVADPSNLQESDAWATEFCDALRHTGKAMEESYISVTGPGFRTLAQVYGKQWEELKRLKEKYDPNGVFDLAIPMIRTGLA